MRKLTFTLLASLFVLGFTQAQVVFDPATIDAGTLPTGQEIVEIDGAMYLKVTLDGWNSVVAFPAITVNADITHFKVMAKYEEGSSGYTMDQVNTFVQVCKRNPWATYGSVGAASSADFKLYSYATTAQELEVDGVQLAGQETTGWSAVVGDYMYIGAIIAYDASVLFDPAAIDPSTLPAGMEIVDLDGQSVLKATVDGWSTVLPISPFETGINNKVKVELAYGQGTSTVAPADANLFVQAMNGGSTALFSVGLQKPTGSLTEVNGDAKSNVLVDGLQIAVQDMANGWNATTGAFVYISKITVSYYALNLATPLNTADVNYTTLPVEIDGLYDDAYDASVVNKVARVALGSVNGTAAAAGAEVASNSDSYGELMMVCDKDNLYLYLDVIDDDIWPLGTSTTPWLNDGVELFMDLKDRRYVGSSRIEGEQHQCRFNVGTDGPAHGNDETGANALGMPGFFLINDTTNINFAIISGSNGYSVEIAVPWVTYFRTNTNTNAEALAMVADGIANNMKIGFEFSLIDASAVDTRKSILNWANNTGLDKAYTSPEFWGQLTLKGIPVGISQKTAIQSLSVYPNPANNQLTLEMANLTTVDIFSMLGSKVFSAQMNNSNKLDVSSLNIGVYVVKATDTDGQVAITKFNKK